MKKLIKLMADYQCYPLWEYDELGLVGNLDPESLPISIELVSQLNLWSKLYDDTLCMDDPIKSGFSTLEEEVEFKKLAESLVKNLRKELKGKYEVISDY